MGKKTERRIPTNVKSAVVHPGGNGDRVGKLLEGLEIVLRHHNAPKRVVDSFKDQMTQYLTVDCEETFLKRAKYMLLVPMAKYLKNDLPKEPDQIFAWSGEFKKWSRPRLRIYSKANTHLWYSFLQAKRSAAPVSNDIVLSNFEKHREQMEAPDPVVIDPCSEDLKDRIMDLLEPLLSSLGEDLDVELTGFFENPAREVHKASESACFESSRRLGGQCGFIRSEIAPSDGLREIEGLFDMRHRTGHSRDDSGRVDVDRVIQDTCRSGELSDLEEVLDEEIRKVESVPLYNATVEAVLEPMKVRTISKGPAIPYYLAKRVQKVLHTLMRRLPAFRLIGRPFCPTDLMDLVSAEGTLDGKYWLSIDYSSATDGLSATLSKEILERLLRDLAVKNMRLYYLLLGVLAPHYVHYPPVKNGDGEKVKLPSVIQNNGQLMGSVLSFPILCLANFGLFLAVKQACGINLPMAKALNSVLINGDDCIYIGGREEWDIHHELGGLIGLKMSPGKAYIHERYANINSVCVDYPFKQSQTVQDVENELTMALHDIHEVSLMDPSNEEENREKESRYSEMNEIVNKYLETISYLEKFGPSRSHPVEIPYLNTGLFVGNHKIMGKVGDTYDPTSETPYITVLPEIVRGSLESKRKDIFCLYVARHSESIANEAKGRNLFIPTTLGGLGIPPIKGVSWSVTPSQMSLAISLVQKSFYLMPLVRPLPRGRFISQEEGRSHDPIQLKADCSSSWGRVLGRRPTTPDYPEWVFNFAWGYYKKVDKRPSA